MSSQYVRTEIKAFMATGIPSEKTLDISGVFDELKKFLSDETVGPRDNWLGIQFIPSEDVPITIGSTNTKGKYREIGSIFIHVVAVASKVERDNIVPRGETIRDAFRGKRIGAQSDIVIEGVVPLNYEAAATLQFEGGYTSASIVVNYYRDFDF